MGVRISKKTVMKAVEDSGGIILALSKRTGVPYASLYEWLHRPENEDVMEAMQKERFKFVDLAETKLITKVNNGDDWAVKYVLSTLGKQRGYTEKTEIQHEGLQKVEVEFLLPDNKKEFIEAQVKKEVIDDKRKVEDKSSTDEETS